MWRAGPIFINLQNHTEYLAFSRVSLVFIDYGQHLSKKELSTSNGMDLKAMNWENIMTQGFL